MIYKYNIVEKVEGNSKHHLFDYYEVRDKLVKLFGEPKNDEEHKLLHKWIKKCMDVIPVFVISKDKHNQYHKNIQSNRVVKCRMDVDKEIEKTKKKCDKLEQDIVGIQSKMLSESIRHI